MFARLKTTNYLSAVFMTLEAMQKHMDVALTFDANGCLTEAAIANVAVVDAKGALVPVSYTHLDVYKRQGLVQKIFYTHLPLAWWSFVSFFLVCVSGVAYLKTRNRHWDAVAGAAAEVGVVLSGLALVSGSIWARH